MFFYYICVILQYKLGYENSLLFRFELFRLLRNNAFCNRCTVKFYRHSLMTVNKAVQQVQAGFTGTVRLAIRTAPDLSTATLVS